MLKRAILARAFRPMLKQTWAPRPRAVTAVTPVAAIPSRTFYIRPDGEADADSHLATSHLDSLERDLGRIKLQLSSAATSSEGSLLSEAAQIRRARQLLTSTLRDLEALVPEEDLTAPTTRHSQGFFNPTFHSPHGSAYSPLEASDSTTTSAFEQALAEPVQARVGGSEYTMESYQVHPELEVTVAEQAREDVATSGGNSGPYHATAQHDPAAPHFVSGEANLAADNATSHASFAAVPQSYLEVTTEPELESLWAKEAADMASGTTFEPKVSGAGAIESLHGYHHTV
ncbi:hypothetical protein H4R34_001442 [Dimargaris verticillata]|uniref:Uncharacterized protein n=1 Tax=Dimargaris verticillata TaxID=2761393 RepID=A0A9W8B5H0_9FUNG|nr:hypothetical protein H4R34_001442 [Dimargaris verticillata]